MSHAVTGIQGQLLEINVVGCRNLADKEWFSRQDPYVIVEYAQSKFRTRVHTDGGKNPMFNEKFMIPLIEGLREVNVQVWNKNTLALDDHIGDARVLLDKALRGGYDNTAWVLKSKHGRNAGEVNLILHYAGSRKEEKHGAAYGAVPSHGFPPPVLSGYPVHAGAAYGVPQASSAYVAPPHYQAPASYPNSVPAGFPTSVSFHAAPPAYPSTNAYPTVSSGYPAAPPTGYAPPPPAGYSHSSSFSAHAYPSYPAPTQAYPSYPAPAQTYPAAPAGLSPYPGPPYGAGGGYPVHYHS